MSNEELVKKMQEERERAYRTYREAELNEEETKLVLIAGILEGMDIMIDLIEDYIKEE